MPKRRSFAPDDPAIPIRVDAERLRQKIDPPAEGVREMLLWRGQHSEARLLALAEGAEMPRGEWPGEAFLLVLEGHVRFRVSASDTHRRVGELLALPEGAQAPGRAMAPSKVLVVVAGV